MLLHMLKARTEFTGQDTETSLAFLVDTLGEFDLKMMRFSVDNELFSHLATFDEVKTAFEDMLQVDVLVERALKV